jgi:hypothetical protein
MSTLSCWPIPHQVCRQEISNAGVSHAVVLILSLPCHLIRAHRFLVMAVVDAAFEGKNRDKAIAVARRPKLLLPSINLTEGAAMALGLSALPSTAWSFNAGVMLLQLDTWREEGLTQRLLDFSSKLSAAGFRGLPGMSTPSDTQSVLCLFFQNASRGRSAIEKIPAQWNVDGLGWKLDRIPHRSLCTARALHWSGPYKPWMRSNTKSLHSQQVGRLWQTRGGGPVATTRSLAAEAIAWVSGARHLWSWPWKKRQLVIPPSCQWAIEELFIFQRSEVTRSKTPMHRQGIDAAAVSTVISDVFATFAHELPPAPLDSELRILDIGSGLAMYHVHLVRHYSGIKVQHFLCDQSANEVPAHHKAAHGGWHADRLPFYNSMECARAINTANGVDGTRWHSINASQESESELGAGSIDVAMSILSCGFHYPVDTYARSLRHVLRPGSGRLLLTLRATTLQAQLHTLEGLGFLCDHSSRHIPTTQKWSLVVCRVLSLKW